MKVATPEYRLLHKWVAYHRGKPTECENCSIDSDERIIEWANVSGNYEKSLDDYVALCRVCHRHYDTELAKECGKGHEYTEENTIWKKTRRQCRKCQNEYNKAYWRRTR